jgi:catechol 2,3-dioxygenase-like lactoylglutathione lyase family enzyme
VPHSSPTTGLNQVPAQPHHPLGPVLKAHPCGERSPTYYALGMKRSLPTLIALVLCALMDAARPAAADGLLRAALIVSDAERSVAFYRVLGFEIEMDQANPRQPEGNFFPLNVPATAVRLVIMAHRDEVGGKIGLVEFASPTPTEARRDPTTVGIGDVVLVFDTADADASHADLQAINAEILEPPQTYRSKKTAADGRALFGKVFHARDPDGYLIELLQAPR